MRSSLFIYFLFLGLCGRTQFHFILDSSKIQDLNTASHAEALPFISADGLRLYYTSGREGFGRVYFSERKDPDSPFYRSYPLSENLPDSFFGATLTSDELEMYLTDGWTSYYSHRKNENEAFTFPVPIKGLGRCYRQPSISPKGNELIAIKRSGCESSRITRDTVRLYTKNVAGVFEQSYTLEYPEDFDPGPGQFSKNGLRYIMGVRKKWYDYNRAWVDSTLILKYSRNSVEEPFGKYEIILNELEKKPFQITMDSSERIMIAVVNHKTLEWRANDLVYYTIENNYKENSVPVTTVKLINKRTPQMRGSVFTSLIAKMNQ